MTTSVLATASDARATRERAASIAGHVERALVDELSAYPKPGLVSRVDAGAHDDMDHRTMLASIHALQPYFEHIALAGTRGEEFIETLRPLGIEAERTMLRATNGVNTHRGAIFCLGLLAAAVGRCGAEGGATSPDAVRGALLRAWGDALDAYQRARARAGSHGGAVRMEFGVGGAPVEAASGFPAVFEVGVPGLRRAREAGLDANAAHVQALFELIAVVPDTNVLYRGGAEGNDLVQARASEFLSRGGCHEPGWWARAEEIHAELVMVHLSPGGCADLLSASSFILSVTDAR